MEKLNNLTLLDCTLRDGGYYNNWSFDKDHVIRYLAAMSEIGISFVEVGFRFLPGSKKLGPYAYTEEPFLESLDLPDDLSYGVMINGKDFILEKNPITSLNKTFDRAENSIISLVRIAINFNQAERVELIAKELKSLGYKVGLNLMQAGYKENQEYSLIAKTIDSWSAVDVLYFADSFGNMDPEEVNRITNVFKKNWKGDLGIHTHNNKGLALINSLSAINSGVRWCDSTLAGMGRGAGNVQTENLILELMPKGNYLELQKSLVDFTKLKDIYNWGTNFHYHFAASNNIHPTFVQTLLSDDRYSTDQIATILELLANMDSKAFTKNSISKAVYNDVSGFTELTPSSTSETQEIRMSIDNHFNGSWDATDWLSNEEVLLVGAGNSVKNNLGLINNYIKKNNPKVICLNNNNFIKHDLVHAVAVCNVSRVILDANLFHNLQCPLIMPQSQIGHLLGSSLDNIEILDYGMTLKEGAIEIHPKGCCLNAPYAAAYALALVTQAGSKKISLIGFDGYTATDSRQDEMNSIFSNYQALGNSIPIVSLTPTSYEVECDLIV